MKSKKGFTMVEVMVVIGIIAILTVIIFPAINNIRAKNRDAEKVADISAIQLGLSLYYSQHSNVGYPETLDDLELNKYITHDSLISPNSDLYLYVPLKRSGSDKCTYYHLGVKLELSSGQIDEADKFNSKVEGSEAMNNYEYCRYSGAGIDSDIPNMYHVHP